MEVGSVVGIASCPSRVLPLVLVSHFAASEVGCSEWSRSAKCPISALYNRAEDGAPGFPQRCLLGRHRQLLLVLFVRSLVVGDVEVRRSALEVPDARSRLFD